MSAFPAFSGEYCYHVEILKITTFNWKMMSKKLLVLALTHFVACACMAQTASNTGPAKKPRAASATTAAPKKPVAEKFSFSIIEGDRIDLGYKGIPIVQLVDAIEQKIFLAKGEFESKAEFSKRQEASLASPIIGNLMIGDVMAFNVPISKGRYSINKTVGYEYDAEQGTVNLIPFPNVAHLSGIGSSDTELFSHSGQNMTSYITETVELEKSFYQASNAYGASVKVLKIGKTHYGFSPKTFPDGGVGSNIGIQSQLPFKLPNKEAAMELPKMRALAIMKVRAPYTLNDFDSHDPTRDVPLESYTYKKFLTGDLLGMIFYSGITGQVFARFPEGFGTAATKKTD